MFKCHISNYKTPRDNTGMSLPTNPVIKEKPNWPNVKHSFKSFLRMLIYMSFFGQELKWSSLGQQSLAFRIATNICGQAYLAFQQKLKVIVSKRLESLGTHYYIEQKKRVQ